MMQRHFARRLSCPPAALSYSARGSVWNSDNHTVLRFRCNIGFAETSNLVGGSKLQWRRSSFAACATSDSSSEAGKGRKRVSKDERRSMVESFVNKYRAMNSGKFPTAKEAQKEVGGSYYTVRMVVQELQYKSQMPGINIRKESQIQKQTIKKVVEDVLNNQIAAEADVVYTEEMVERPVENGEATKGELKISDDVNKIHEAPMRKVLAGETELLETEAPSVAQTTSDTEALKNDSPTLMTSWEKQDDLKNDLSPEVKPVSSYPTTSAEVETSNITNDYTNVGSDDHLQEDTSPEISEEKTSFSKIKTSTGDKPQELTRERERECDVMMTKDDRLEQSPEPEKFILDSSKEHNDDADSPKKSFTWKGLKSLADGLLNMWRKL